MERMGKMSRFEFVQATITKLMQRQADTEAMRSMDADFDTVPVRIYMPTKRASHGAALFYVHGGGWTWCSVDSYDPLVRRMAEHLNLLIVSVEYVALSVKHPERCCCKSRICFQEKTRAAT
jgi:acetyl esterase/lipase